MGLTILADSSRRVIVRAALVVVAFAPILSLASLGDPFQAPRALAVAVAALAMSLAAARSDTGMPRLPRVLAVSATALVAAVAVATVANHPASSVWGVHGRFQGVVSFAILVAVGYGGWIAGRKETGWLGGALGASVLLQSALVIAQAVTTGIPDGAFGNRAVAAGWLGVGIAVALASAITSAGTRRATLWATAAIGTLALGATGTRGAWLGLLLALGTAYIASGPGRLRRGVVAASVAAVALVAAGAMLAGAESTGKLSPAALTSGSASARLEIWRGTAAMAADNPLFGVGPGRFIYEFPRYETIDHARIEGPGVRADTAHNVVLQYAAETGLVGGAAVLVLATAVLIAGLAGARARSGHAFIATVGFAAYMGQALTGVPAIETDALGWLLGGMAVAGSTALAAGRSEPARHRIARTVMPVVAAVLVAMTALYLSATALHGSGLALFESGDLRGAARQHDAAIGRDPLTDVYRVALSDSALYLRGETLAAARSIIEDGIALEPRSYDLLLARARLLAAEQRPAAVIAQAYLDAVDAYPLDVTARREAIGALAEAGRIDAAVTMARELLRLVPEDPVANQMVK